MTRADGGSAANDMITTGTHVGTHIDALAHVSHNGKMYGGDRRRRGRSSAASTTSSACTRSSRWSAAACCSTCPAQLGLDHCAGRLRDHRRRPRGAPARSRAQRRRRRRRARCAAGGGSCFDEGDAYLGRETRRARGRARPGRGGWPRGACTQSAPTPSPSSGWRPPAGTRCCRRTGCCWSSTASTSSSRSTSRTWLPRAHHEFTFVLVPLNIYGATGSPVRPLAVVPA